MNTPSNSLYIGLMSGTSLDGVDGVLVAMPDAAHAQDGQPVQALQLLASAYMPFSAELRQYALDLQQPDANELHREALLANQIAQRYADCVAALVAQKPDAQIVAIGAHGQTIRHRPELGYTRQSLNPALLAELTAIDVIADFRQRDIAAGGQGAPLVPAFHRAIFGQANVCRVVVNMGGMSNISILHADGTTTGFDIGPGNVLMDAWIAQHHHKMYDDNGAWGAQGTADGALLKVLLAEPFFQMAAPKSTGRDLFSPAWLAQKLNAFTHLAAVDVQATLTALTAISVADAIARYAPEVSDVFVCGGGAYNAFLLRQLTHALQQHGCQARVQTTDALGVSPAHVEALAFAWLAQCFITRQAGNSPQVTGAKGLRMLGALYPA